MHSPAPASSPGALTLTPHADVRLLGDLAWMLQSLHEEAAILQASIDLILARLDLDAGWIFLAAPPDGGMRLAASRGIDESFGASVSAGGPGPCLCSDVIESGLPMVARNTADCPRMPMMRGEEELLSHACIPLTFGRGVLGVMNIAARGDSSFSQDELALLETAGRQIALAVDRARTARAEARRGREARALVTLSLTIGQSLDLDKILPALDGCTRELLGADRACVLIGPAIASMRLGHASGEPPAGLEIGAQVDLAAFFPQRCLTGLLEGRTLALPGNETSWREEGTCLLLPLVAHGRPNGLLIADRRKPAEWSLDQIEQAEAMARQAAVAIENARLYAESKDALLRLQQAHYGMVQAERLSALGTLASCLAHEVRNPLNSINLQLVLLARRAARLDPPAREEQSALIESARREIARLDDLVEEFLSLSSIDRLRLEETDPAELVRDVIALMMPMAAERGVRLVESIERATPRLHLDKEKMKQVLINLVRNAVEAMPGGGTATISCKTQGGRLLLTVADTGTGIESGLDVFDFFVTTKRGGTGLGLPIARRIVEAHGGTLTFISSPDKGATFQVEMGAA